MARKRKKTRLNWAPILWLALGLNLAAGLLLSPATAVSRVRIEGAAEGETEAARLNQALQKISDQPALRARTWTALEEVHRRPDVKTASLTVNLLGRGLLKVSYYEPVAVLTSNPNLSLSSEGTIIPSRPGSNDLPSVQLFPDALNAQATLSGGWEGKPVADICRRAEAARLPNVTVEVTQNGAVSLRLGKEARVVLGLPDKLDAKFERLAQVRAQDQRILTGGTELVLIAPDRPVVRKMGVEP
jgi:cell division septal protein FtsQ